MILSTLQQKQIYRPNLDQWRSGQARCCRNSQTGEMKAKDIRKQ